MSLVIVGDGTGALCIALEFGGAGRACRRWASKRAPSFGTRAKVDKGERGCGSRVLGANVRLAGHIDGQYGSWRASSTSGTRGSCGRGSRMAGAEISSHHGVLGGVMFDSHQGRSPHAEQVGNSGYA